MLRPIAYDNTEVKYGAPKAEIVAVKNSVEKNRAHLRSVLLKLRENNWVLSWLKTYLVDQSYNGRWIMLLDGYYTVIEHRTRDEHQIGYNLNKKTVFCELHEKRGQIDPNKR